MTTTSPSICYRRCSCPPPCLRAAICLNADRALIISVVRHWVNSFNSRSTIRSSSTIASISIPLFGPAVVASWLSTLLSAPPSPTILASISSPLFGPAVVASRFFTLLLSAPRSKIKRLCRSNSASIAGPCSASAIASSRCRDNPPR